MCVPNIYFGNTIGYDVLINRANFTIASLQCKFVSQVENTNTYQDTHISSQKVPTQKPSEMFHMMRKKKL
jgi:hypothetical protein